MILDVDVGEADTEEGRRDHRADEGCAVTADNHGNGDRECLYAEGCADGDHNRKHTIEVGIRIEAECKRYRQDADDEWQVLAEGCRKDHRDDTRHVGHDRGLHHLHARLRDRSCAVSIESIYQNTHQNRCAHERRAHHQRRTCVTVDHLLLKLDRSVVHEEGGCHTKHERIVARELIPYEHRDDRDGEGNVKGEKLRAGIFVLVCRMLCLFCCILAACGLCELTVETCASLLLLHTGEYRVYEAEEDTENLDRDQLIPELTSLHAENGSGTHGRAGPRHQVENTHREDSDTKQGRLSHVHLLVYRKHRRNDDQEGRRSTTIEVADQRDDCGHDGNADNIVPDILHQLVDDDVEHAGVGHDAEEQHGKYEQCGGRAGALEAALDEVTDLLDRVVAADHQNQRQQRRKNDEGHARSGFALKQRHHERDDTCES